MKRPRSPSPGSMPLSSPPKHSARSTPDLPALISHQEIFLRILSFLDPTHLAHVQRVNKYWAAMSLDPQLWKRLYLQRYPHPHHSKLMYKSDHEATSTPSRPSTPGSGSGLRPIARLPSRAFPPPSPGRSPASVLRTPRDAVESPQTSSTGRSAGTGHAIPLSRSEAARIGGQDEVGSGVRNDGVDWKMMLRLGTNWSRGNASSQTIITLPPSPSPSITSTDAQIPQHNHETPTQYSNQHIALSPSFIFTSNPTSPLVHVYPSSNPSTRLGIIPPPPGWSSPSRPDNITAIAADQSVTPNDNENNGVGRDLPARLAVFYQSGGYVVLSISTTETGGSKRLVWNRQSMLSPTTRPASLRRRTTNYAPPISGDPVVLAVLHHPVLITCTLAFHLSVYSLPGTSSGSSTPRHLSTLHSGVSFHPAALSLFPSQSETLGRPPTPQSIAGETDFRASLTYCTPVYPSSWTVAAQEFEITLSDDEGSDGQVTRAECYHVGNDIEDEDGEEIVWPRRIKPVIGVKGRRATGIGTDGRWCVLSGRDNQIQVYALPHPASPLSPPPSPTLYHRNRSKSGALPGPSIQHRQTLLAHSADVTSLSLTAGRCVSGGSDGRVLVWDLDKDTDETGEGRVGKTVGYVEVRTGLERVWRGAAGPRLSQASRAGDDVSTLIDEDDGDEYGGTPRLPHPQAISGAARSLFLPRPPESERREQARPAIRQLTFDEERIVGLVRGELGGGEVMKVWNFNG